MRSVRLSSAIINSDQCDGLPPEIATTAPPPPPGLIEPQVEYLVKATGIDFRIGGNRAFYVPTEDYVQVPHRKPTSNRSIGIERPSTSWRIMPGSRLCRYLFLPSRMRWPPAR